MIDIHHPRRTLRLAAATALVMTLVVGACSSSGSTKAATQDKNEKATLTLYSGQHEDLTKELVAAFEQESGIHINVRSGEDGDMINQILEEKSRTKADLVMTEEPGPIAQLDAEDLLSRVDDSSFDSIDKRMIPGDKNWAPYAARSRAIFYNPKLIAEADLPKSIMDLEQPEWKGKFAYAPSGAFVSTVTYLVNTIGEDKTLAWLKAIKANGVNEQKNGKVRDSVEAGRHAFGLSNHYYWYILAEEKGADTLQSKVHYMKDGDAGALVLASGVGILKTSKHQAEGQKFVAFLTSADGGQKIIANDTPQYPVREGVKSTKGLDPISQLEPPKFDQGSLADISKARELMTQAGI